MLPSRQKMKSRLGIDRTPQTSPSQSVSDLVSLPWKRLAIVQLTARSSQHFSLATTILSVERLHSKRVYSSIQKIQIPFPSVVTGASWLRTPPQEPIWETIS